MGKEKLNRAQQNSLLKEGEDGKEGGRDKGWSEGGTARQTRRRKELGMESNPTLDLCIQ